MKPTLKATFEFQINTFNNLEGNLRFIEKGNGPDSGTIETVKYDANNPEQHLIELAERGYDVENFTIHDFSAQIDGIGAGIPFYLPGLKKHV